MKTEEANQSTIVDAAKGFAKLGFRVIPLHTPNLAGGCSCDNEDCSSPGKHPRIKWLADASDEEKSIEHWWSIWPSANLAIVAGNGIFVVDIDGADGEKGLSDLQAKHGPLPRTRVHITGSGRHLFFRSEKEIGNSVGSIAPGVDIRGEGGYVVAPPSLHASGKVYLVESDFEIAEAPEWLVALTDEKKKSGPRTSDGKTTLRFTGDGRNNNLFKLAAGMRGRGIGIDGIYGSLISVNNESNFPPLSDKEVYSIASSAATYVPENLKEMPEGADPDEYLKENAWKANLRVNQKGIPESTDQNVVLLLTYHKDWRDTLAYNEFRDCAIWNKVPPGGELLRKTICAGDPIRERDEILVQKWCGDREMNIQSSNAMRCLVTAAEANRFHPVRDWLDEQVWDGKSRVDSWLIDYMKAEDSLYTRTVGKCWLISAIARIMQPGCQVDHTMILEGAQGVGKSQGVKALFTEQWYMPNLPSLDNKDSMQSLLGHWVVEIAELVAFKGREFNRIKDFLTRGTDKFRVPYGRSFADFPRQCVFVGTTNDFTYLNDPTGARRFWPVHVRRVNVKKLREDRNQLWAEAYRLYKDGNPWYSTDDQFHLEAEHVRLQRDQSRDAWEELIESWSYDKSEVTLPELMRGALAMPNPEHWSKQVTHRVGYLMRKLGWETQRKRVGKVKVTVYLRKECSDPISVMA